MSTLLILSKESAENKLNTRFAISMGAIIAEFFTGSFRNTRVYAYLTLVSIIYTYRARWRENRTIFNTPNPRLMNVSLLRENKLLHGQERRGSRMSVRIPSRQPSMASLRPHSPNPSIGKFLCEFIYDEQNQFILCPLIDTPLAEWKWG